MNLRTISDLTNNRLVMYPGVIYSTIIDNRYGGESIYKVRWYQPHNDYGRPDSYSLKWFAYEMLGYKGYDNGYIEYYSNINFEKKKIFTGSKVEEVNYKTDLMALQKITGDNTMTFAKYKDLRFTNVENNLQYIQYINVDEIYNEFLEALKKDAAYVKQVEAEALVKYPGDDTNSVNARNNLISAARKFENSTAVRRKVYYTIKNSSNDFMTDVYNKNNSQNVTLVNFQN